MIVMVVTDGHHVGAGSATQSFAIATSALPTEPPLQPPTFSFLQGLKDGRHDINRARKTKQKCIVCRNSHFTKVENYSVIFMVVHFIEQLL